MEDTARPTGPLIEPLKGRIVLVSDDRDSGFIWLQVLRRRGLDVAVIDFESCTIERLVDETADLILFDLYDESHIDLDFLRLVRAEVATLLVLLLPDTNETLAVRALEAGVDDCLYKPLNPRFLLAKLQAWLRRSSMAPLEILVEADTPSFHLDNIRRRLVHSSGQVVRLTNLEFRLLYILMSSPGEVFESMLLAQRIWGYSEADTTLLKNVVYRLRRKIEPNPGDPQFLLSVAGVGYTFNPSLPATRSYSDGG